MADTLGSLFEIDNALSAPPEDESPSLNLFIKETLLMEGYIRENNIKLSMCQNNKVPIPILILVIKFFEFIPIQWDKQKVIACSSECLTMSFNLAVNLSREPDGAHWWTTWMNQDKNHWVVFDLEQPLRIYGYQIAMGNQQWGPKTYKIEAINDSDTAINTFRNKNDPDDYIKIVDNVYFERDEGKWEHNKLATKELLEKYPHFKDNYDGMDTWASTHPLSEYHQLNTMRRYWKIHIYECKENGGYIAMNRVRFLKKFVQ